MYIIYACSKDGTNIFPRRISKRRDKEAFNLLMLENDDGFHYTLITNLNALLRYNSRAKEFFPYCCHGFDKRSLKPGQMKAHMETCFTYGGCKVKMPEMGKNTIEFTQYYKQQVAPYIIYAYFEALMNKI